MGVTTQDRAKNEAVGKIRKAIARGEIGQALRITTQAAEEWPNWAQILRTRLGTTEQKRLERAKLRKQRIEDTIGEALLEGIALPSHNNEAAWMAQQRNRANQREQARARWPRRIQEDAKTSAQKGDEGAREDRRDIGFIAIDPENAKDRDDAVWCERVDKGWRLHVAVSDVASYVRTGSNLDGHVRTRAQTVYRTNGTTPMCPEILSHGTCSLEAGRDRRALVTIIEVSEKGTTKTIETMVRTTIRTDRAISYEDALEEIDEGENVLCEIARCANALREQRRRTGAIMLNTSDETIIIKDNTGQTWGTQYRSRDQARTMIEEAMIAVNIANARWLANEEKTQAVYRTHWKPRTKALKHAKNEAEAIGVRTNAEGTRESIVAMLEASGSERALIEQIVRETLPKACYTDDPEGGHFALGTDCYAHTTSPIRRYADLYCQQWAHALRGQGRQPTHELNLGPALTEAEVNTKKQEREDKQRITAKIVLKTHGDEWHNATVMKINHWGVFVEMDRYAGIQAVGQEGKGHKHGEKWWSPDLENKEQFWRGLRVKAKVNDVDGKGRLRVKIHT